MFGQLIPAGGGVPVPLTKERVVLGRAPGCDVVLSVKAISGRHCELVRKDGYWWVTDLDSHNGTGVNGVKCRRKRLRPNDTLCLPRARFHVVYDLPGGSAENSDDDLALSMLNEMDAQQTASTVLQPPEEDTRPSRRDDSRSSPSQHEERSAAPRTSSPSTGKRFRGKLVPHGGGEPIALLDPEILIGRSRKSDIRLKFPTVSGRHCTLTYEDGYWFVEDLSSSNGVRVNGQRVDRRHLMPGDELAVASHRFTIEYTAEGEPPVEEDLTSKNLLEKAGLQNLMKSDKLPGWITSHEKNTDEGPRKYRLDDSDPD
jgi:pSer/pThr/pTyr-binding forkhead associated (FHA) protein